MTVTTAPMIALDSIAALRSAAGVGLPNMVFVYGTSVAFDGGQTMYAKNPTDFTTADNGTTVIVTGDGYRFNQVTDVTAAQIAAAMASAPLPASSGGTGLTALGADVPTFLGTPASAPLAFALTNATGLPLTTGVTGLLPVASGGTNQAAFSPEQILWKLTAANMNSTADQAFTKTITFSTYLITRIRTANASASMTIAAGGIYNAASKSGPVVAATQVYSTLTGATLGLDLTLAALGAGVQSAATLFLSLTTGLGSAGTADFYVFGTVLS